VTPTGRRILVAGMLAGDPGQGGASWALLQWVLGLQRLGHRVVVIDPIGEDPAPNATVEYFERLCRRHGLTGRAALLPASGAPIGMDSDALRDFVRRADILCNVSGRLRDAELVKHVPLRLYVDVDPGFTQLWHASGVDMGLARHTHHLTAGTALGTSRACVPSLDIDWRPFLPPVVLDQWPRRPPPAARVLTSVANWRSYGSIEHGGLRFGQKAHSYRALLPLASLSKVPIAIALSIHDGDHADRAALAHAGWNLVDPSTEAGDTERYRAFVQASWAELGVAKSGYVVGKTGWLSDRSACYLATGRPVIAQDTGFTDAIPAHSGMLAYATVDEAVDHVNRLEREYDHHAHAARRVAEDHLDARRVLGEVMRWATA
jgi:hypothetical protein